MLATARAIGEHTNLLLLSKPFDREALTTKVREVSEFDFSWKVGARKWLFLQHFCCHRRIYELI
jgi:hypothetical protein